jgi:hypothetical protein
MRQKHFAICVWPTIKLAEANRLVFAAYRPSKSLLPMAKSFMCSAAIYAGNEWVIRAVKDTSLKG